LAAYYEFVRPRAKFALQAKNMKYAALTPKNTMNRTTLATEIPDGIVPTLTAHLALFRDRERARSSTANKQLANAVPDCAEKGAFDPSLLPFVEDRINRLLNER
jgi:hypothetical protein